MEEKTEKVVPSKTSPWIECESKSRPGNKYLFNIATGERKWVKPGLSPEKPTKAFSSPANDRLKRLQRDLQKPKSLNKSEEKDSTTKKFQKAPTTSKKTIATETVRPPLTPKECLKILQSKAIREQLKNEEKKILNAKTTSPLVPKSSKKNNETVEEFKQRAKKRTASQAETTVEKESLNTPEKCRKYVSKELKSGCVAKKGIITPISSFENTKKVLEDSGRKSPLKDQKPQASEKSETNIPDLKFLTEIPNNNCTPLKHLKCSANKRLENLRRTLQAKNIDNDQTSHSSENSINNSKVECSFEPMDWEPTDEPSTSLLSLDSSALRNNNIVKEPTNMEVDENLMLVAAEDKQLIKTFEQKWRKDFVYIVLDTNVFIHHLSFIEQLRSKKIRDVPGNILYIPYSVLQELDKLKLRENVRASVVLAIKYLNKMFEEKYELIQAQSALEERKHLINVESPDDSILNCCLQVQAHIPSVILFSEDVNLRNKAICNNINVSTKSDLVQKLSKLT